MSPSSALKAVEPDGVAWPEFAIETFGHRVAALGVDLKNSLCIADSGTARLSGVHGDINDPAVHRTVSALLQEVEGVDAVACDLHPDLHATRLAMALAGRLDVPLIHVQHHHAHIAAVMAEHGLEEAVGLALDGFGYGTDGEAWGGECLYVDASGFRRMGHLPSVAMPGGDAASREPWRMAVAVAWLEDEELCQRLFPDRPVTMIRQLCSSASTPHTSSAGRIFDAASAMILGCEVQSFEGEAAIELEKRATKATETVQLDPEPAVMLCQIADFILKGADRAALALGFHHALADYFASMALRAAGEKGVSDVVLAGGCFMNRLLRERIIARLETAGLKTFLGERLPHGDGAVELGQAWVALRELQRGVV